MRGIQINNYFNNHITLNGKKTNNEPHHLAITNRPKLKDQPALQPENLTHSKSPPAKGHPLTHKKRTNTLVELKKNVPQKRSISVQRQRNATSTKKKEKQEHISDQSQKQEEPLINMSQRKLKSVNSKGLGKRSKSTIIKTNNVENLRELPRKESECLKREVKKVNSNATVQSVKSKTNRKKHSKIGQTNIKEMKTNQKINASRKELIQNVSKDMHKKQKMSIKIDKIKQSDRVQKKSARTHLKVNTPIVQKKSNCKPISARQKKSKKSIFIQQLKQKYQNQVILNEQITERQEDKGNMDNQFLSVMSSLQKVLTSVGSKHKLKKQLQIINQKLKEFKLQTDSSNSEQQKQQISDQLYISQKPTFEKQVNGNMVVVKSKSDSQDEEQQYAQQQPLIHKMVEQQNDITIQQQQQDFDYNPLIKKRKNQFVIETIEKEEIKQDVNDRKKEIQMLKMFKNTSTQMMVKAGLKVITKEPQINNEPLVLNNVSDASNSSNNSHDSSHIRQDKYPQLNPKSPKFDESQLIGVITLKEQFLSSKHDKMSELVKKMFEKQLVSPRSFEWQMKSLNKKYQQENSALESFKKQAEQLTSLLSEIKKDKQQIQGIDELLRNQKWEQAKQLVAQNKVQTKLQTIKQQLQNKWKQQNQGFKATTKPEIQQIKLHLDDWEKEGGWERVKIKRSDIEDNEFVDIGQMTNRRRRMAQAEVDIDQQCGNTQESVDLQSQDIKEKQQQKQEYIYYNGEEENESKSDLDGGLIRLVEVVQQQQHQNQSSGDVFYIKDEPGHIDNDPGHIDNDHQPSVEKNVSQISVCSSLQKNGFVTNLYFIKEYCIALCEFVRDNQIFKQQFKYNASKPLQFNLPKFIAQLRNQESQQYQFQSRTNKLAISQLIWNQFNAQYDTLKYNNLSKGKQTQKYKIQKQFQIIFVKMIYDVLNQSLDYERPGGQSGKALPWNNNAKHLKNIKPFSKDQNQGVQAYDLMFGVAIARIIQWGSCLCGFLPDTVQLQNTEIDEPYVNHIRLTRMQFLLQKMMAEQESMMTNFQLQQTDIQYRLSQLIYSQLIDQASSQLQELFQLNF